jgi:hypothetical protein
VYGDEVRRLNQDIGRLQTHLVDVDKRVVRLETLVAFSSHQRRLDS